MSESSKSMQSEILQDRRVGDAPARRRVAARGLGRLGRLLRRLEHDRRGATAVQAIVMMPIFIFFIGASVLLWQTVNIRKSFNNGVYEATRFLSLYPPADTNPYTWEVVARKMVEAELLNNPWVKEPVSDAVLRVTVNVFDGNDCGAEFEVNASYRLFGPVGATSGGNSVGGILPGMAPVQLRESRQGVVICD